MSFDLSTAQPITTGGFDLSTAKPVDSSAPADAPTPTSSFSDFLKNAASAAVRPVIKAVTALPAMAADTGVALRNLGTNLSQGITPTFADFNPFAKSGGTPQTYELPSQSFNRALDTVTRAPEGFAGKGAEFISTLAAGGALPAPQVQSNVPGNFVPLSRDVLRTYDQPGAPSTFQASGGGSGFGSVGADSSAGLNSAQQRAATLGEQMGFKLTPGQASGSRSLQQFEAKLESQPMTSGPFNALKDTNQRALNTISAQSIGEQSATLDSSVLERASERLGNTFENVRNAGRIVMQDPAVTGKTLDNIDQEFSGLLPGDMAIRDNKLVSQLDTLMSGGNANGQQLGSLSSKLGRAAFKQMSSPNGDRDLGQALYQVKDHVDDLVQSTLNGDEAAGYASARQQYRTLMQLTGRTGIVNPASGNVSGATLANRLQQTDRSGYLLGKNQSDLYNAARFAQTFKPIVGDSGTATRSMITNPMQLLGSIPGNMIARAYLSPSGMAAAPAVVNAAGDLPVAIAKGAPWLASKGLPGLAAGLEFGNQNAR